MKRIARAAAAALLTLGLLAQPALAAESKIKIVLQGTPIQFDAGTDPFVESDRTLVPLRKLSEKLGFIVEWEPTTQKISLSKEQTKVVLWVGKLDAEVNGKPVTLGVAPKIVGNVTFVPVRFISEQLGANVYWNEEKQEVRVTPTGQSDPDALAFLMGNLATTTTTPAAPQNEKAHADLWLKISDSPSDPVEITVKVDLQSQGQDLFGDIAATMPLMGVNVPVINAKLAVRNGFAWLKLEGGLALQGLGGTKTKPEWMPIGSLSALGSGMVPGMGTVPPGTTPAPKFDQAEIEKLAKEIMGQVLVTYGPSEVKDGKKLVRVDLDLSHVDFMGIMGKMFGQAAPADVIASAQKLKLNWKMSLLVEEGSKTLRSLTMEMVGTDDQTKVEMKLNITADPSTTAITWPTDLPANPPAVPATPVKP